MKSAFSPNALFVLPVGDALAFCQPSFLRACHSEERKRRGIPNLPKRFRACHSEELALALRGIPGTPASAAFAVAGVGGIGSAAPGFEEDSPTQSRRLQPPRGKR